MVYDICLKIKDLGDIYGSFIKSTTNSIYLSNAILAKSSVVSIALFKIEKKYVMTATRMAAPFFDNFTDDQLLKVIAMNNLEYTQAAQKILDSRKKEIKQNFKAKVESPKQATIKSMPQQEKKEWDQFEANRKLFGVEPTFNVDEYACSIDRSRSDYALNQAQADKIAIELEAEANQKRKKPEISEDLQFSTAKATNKWDESKTVENEVKPVAKTINSKVDELQKQLEIINDQINQQKSNFGSDGWGMIAPLLSKKNSIINEINNINNPPPKIQEELSPTKPKKTANKIEETENDQNKNGKSKEKAPQSSKKHSQKHPSIELPTKFGSASEIVDFIFKNFNNQKQDFKPVWSDVQNVKETVNVNLKPLDSFEFSEEKIQRLLKVSSERKNYTLKSFK